MSAPKLRGCSSTGCARGCGLAPIPTIIYGLVGGRGSLGRPIYRSEITKKRRTTRTSSRALPPTPIANPGRASIEAVLRPAETDARYFVADGTGGHVFAETLAEHNRNVAEWRKIEKRMRAEERASRGRAAGRRSGPARTRDRRHGRHGRRRRPGGRANSRWLADPATRARAALKRDP